MSIRTNTTHEQVDTAIRLNLFFVTCTFCIQVRSIAIQDIRIFSLDINMTEEVIPHKRIIAFRMFFRQSYIFIHIECYYILEGNDSFLIQIDQSFVHAQRRRSGRTTQYKRFFRGWIGNFYFCSNVMCSPLRYGLIVRLNNKSHKWIVL